MASMVVRKVRRVDHIVLELRDFELANVQINHLPLTVDEAEELYRLLGKELYGD